MAEAVTRHTRRGLRPATALRLVSVLIVALCVPFSARAEFVDWTDVTWPAGAVGPLVFTGGDLAASTVTATVTHSSGVRPAGFPAIQAGYNGFDNALRLRANFANTSQLISLRYDLAAPVSNLRFDVGDIDTGSASSPYTGWQDILTVTAFRGGVEVPVTATPLGAAVAVDANNSYSTGSNATVYGRNGDVAAASTAGNARFSVAGPVDQIRIDYRAGNAPDNIPGNGPSNPTEQGINFADLIFDAQADLSLTKLASDSTPDVGDTVTYTLTLANGGPAAATGITVADVLPVGLSYVAGSIAGGTAGNGAGAPTLTWDQTTLASGASAVLTYQATVNAPTGAANEYRNAAQVIASAQPDPDSTPNNGMGNGEDDQATVTLTPVTAVAVSGFVYRDDDHDATRDATEPGTGVALFAKLVPAATPGGPASQVVAVDAATGAFSFAGVTSGSYSIVIDTTNTASDVTPTFVAGWLGTEAPDSTRSLTVASTDVTEQDFGLFHGSRVEGAVFEDDGAGGGIAGNGIRDGAEAGIIGAALRAEASGCAGICDSDASTTGGAFVLWIPFAADGQSVAVIETDAAGFVSTGGSAGTTGGSYALATDTVTFTNAAGSVYTSLEFADVSGSSFAPDHQRTAMPGTAVFHPHVFAAGADGTVRFSAANVASPAVAGWAQSVFHDANCSGTLDAAEPQLQPADAIAVAAGGFVCVVLRESVPPGAPYGAQDLVTVTADFSSAGGAAASLTVTDLTIVGLPSGLVLVKSVDKASAEPGEVLGYTIVYRNDGAAPITQLVIADATPNYTTFVPASAACGALPPQLGSCTPAPPAGPTGSVTWTFTGALDPGASGTVTYSVTID